MASTQAMCSSFKQELLTGTHVLGTDTVRIALYLDAATLGAGTTTYQGTVGTTRDTAQSEVTASGSYAYGGSAVTFVAPGLTGTTAWAGPASASTVSWTTFTATGFSAALLFNASKSNKAISVHTFASQSITAGTFTITFPTNGAGTALINLA